MSCQNRLSRADRWTLYYSGKGADLQLTCRGKEILVHKAIVFNCTFFEKACTAGWKESTTNTIDFPDELPVVLDAMLQWLYSGFYFPPMKRQMMEPLSDRESRIPLNDAYNRGLRGEKTEGLSDREHLLFCIDLYSAAERYMLPELQKLIVSSFRHYIHTSSVFIKDPDCFYHVVTAIYENTVEDENLLKNEILARTLSHQLALFGERQDNGRAVLQRSHPDFVIDLIIKLSKSRLQIRNSRSGGVLQTVQ